MNQIIAETLESSGTIVKAQCLDSGAKPTIGSLVVVQQGEDCFVAIVLSATTQSSFPGGFQAFGLQSGVLAQDYPELKFIELKILELSVLLQGSKSDLSFLPACSMPEPHSSVSWPEDQILAKVLARPVFYNVYCAMLLESASPERLFFGLAMQIKFLDKSVRANFYQAIFLKLCQSSPRGLELVGLLCQNLELVEPNLNF